MPSSALEMEEKCSTLPPSEADSCEPFAPGKKVAWYRSLPYFVPGDIDGFAGLFSNNLANMLVGAQMLATILPPEIVFGRIIPGVGVAMFIGCFYYVLQALLTASKHGRHDLCCLPFGISTPGLFAFNSGIIFTVYYAEGGGEQAAEMAWQVGVVANFVQGVVNISLSPFGPHISRAVPMVALLGSLSSVGIAWLYSNTLMLEFSWPLVTIAPFFLLLSSLLAGVKIPHVPTTLVPVFVGAAIAWISGRATISDVVEASAQVGWRPATLHLEPFHEIGRVLPYLGIVIPLAFTVGIGSIQIRQMAANAGDEYNLRWTMVGDGMATIIASFFGSPWGMTVFISHGALKAMGAQIGYAAMTGVAFVIVCFSGLSGLILAVFPAKALNPIILYVGLVVCTQALESMPPRHWPAFLVALVPGFFDWVQQVASNFAAAVCQEGFRINGSIVEAGTDAVCAMGPRASASWALNPTLVAVRALGKGYILTSILWAAMVVHIVDRKFGLASMWAFIAAALSSFGLVHAEFVFLPWQPEGGRFHWELVGGYLLTAIFLLFIELVQQLKKQPSEEAKVIEMDGGCSENDSTADNSERV